MVLKDKTYDILKDISLILPLITTLVITIMKIWNIPYATEVGLTLSAINAFVAGLVKISSKNYSKKNSKKKGK